MLPSSEKIEFGENCGINQILPQRISKDKATDYVSIPQFYAGRSVFITGGTGFMGKVLVEKLLRSCPDIKSIYLLIRPKRGQQIDGRLCELLSSPVFKKIRREQLNKVIPVLGDIESEQLGISKNDQAMLCSTVSIVFHSAAAVRFDEKLKFAISINVLGTKRLVELCHRMLSLDAFIHVSTAYCNCDRTEISEEIYPPPYNAEDIISIASWLSDDVLDKLTPLLIEKHPNTYTFTKALAEHMLFREAGNLPVVIVRPSIVLASLYEPMSGWIDNFNGPTGLVCATGRGLLRISSCKRNCVSDLVPVDIVINLMIASAWRTGTEKSNNFRVYNCCTGERNPITWGRFVDNIVTQMRKQPLENCILYPNITFCTNRRINAIHGFLVHYIPAYVIDFLARLLGKKPFLVNIQNKVTSANDSLEYFTNKQWRFKDNNVQTLLSIMSTMDRKNFIIDIRKIDWEKYLERYILGIRKYLFKQYSESLPSSRKRTMMLYVFHQLQNIISVIFIWHFLMTLSQKLSNIWTGVLKNAMEKLRFF